MYVTEPMFVEEEPDVKLMVCEPLLSFVHVAAAFVFWKLSPPDSAVVPLVALSAVVLDDALTMRTFAVVVGLVVLSLLHAASRERATMRPMPRPSVGRRTIDVLQRV